MSRAIRESLQAVTTAADHLTRLVEARTIEERRTIVEYRRALSQAVFDLGRVVEDAAKRGEMKDDETFARFRKIFDESRRIIALHQAEWPVSGISRDEDSYVISARRSREAKDRLVEYVTKHLI
jgi:hypothetical protein